MYIRGGVGDVQFARVSGLVDDAYLLSLYETLSRKQKDYIIRHLNTFRDSQVLNAPSRQTVYMWRRESLTFQAVYGELKARQWQFPVLEGLAPGSTPQAAAAAVDAVLDTVVQVRANSTVPFDDKAVQLAEQELKKNPGTTPTMGQQLEVMSQHLPRVVRRHLAIILDSTTSNRDALVAIKLFYETMGVTPESLLPTGRMNKMIVNVLQMVGPQMAAVAQERGLELSGEVQRMLHACPELLTVDGEFHTEGGKEVDEIANGDTAGFASEESDGQVPAMLDVSSEGCNRMETTHDSVPLSDNG